MIKGTITVKIDDISFQELERCREIIHQMFLGDVFKTRNGSAILNFDAEGKLGSIKIERNTWNKHYVDMPDLGQYEVALTSDESNVVTTKPK